MTDTTTVSLSAATAASDGGTITYIASLGANAAHSAVTVTLDNGKTITIAAGETSGALTLPAADAFAGVSGALVVSIASITGSGGFESLTFDHRAVTTPPDAAGHHDNGHGATGNSGPGPNSGPDTATLSQATGAATVTLSATAAVAEGGTITYTASVGATPVSSAITVTLDNGQTITHRSGTDQRCGDDGCTCGRVCRNARCASGGDRERYWHRRLSHR